MVFLHGHLDITVVSAAHLPSGESYHLKAVGRLIAKAIGDKNDPYVNVKIGDEKLATTRTLDNADEPVWNEEFVEPICRDFEELEFEVKDKNVVGATPLAYATVSAADIVAAPGYTLDLTLSLIRALKKHEKHKGILKVKIVYRPINVAQAGPECPGTYFKAQPGNRVVLYQDAHNVPGNFPAVSLPDGTNFEVRGCWADIQAAIENAQDFVFLTGWSFHPDVQLVRPGGPKLGELLMRKAEEGITVALLVWDDRSSTMGLGGVMDTHDETMRTYFKGSLVKCELVGRAGGGKSTSLVQGQAASTFFSHHQKSVMCDSDPLPGNSTRRLVAFVGGLDLTKGRYDTAEHTLYRGRDSVFVDDLDNKAFDMKGGWAPKEPWEDIHSQIDGPAAHNVLKNFLERWAQQASEESPPSFNRPDPTSQVSHDPQAFTVQIMRSIDARSAVFEGGHRFFMKKGRAVDRSIYEGYIHQIRRAREFIYIENQYFLGSCYLWSEQTNSLCNQILPAEIMQKIIYKIHAGERFAAYITVPLYPEGIPASDSVKAILRFQKLTMEAMYKGVAQAIHARQAHDPSFQALPTDYLNFYCLGNREEATGWAPPPEIAEPGPGDACYHAVQSRRNMIYVHSKFMVTDDEHAIIGSANINMRSLAGTRDTEIAAGIWQPAHVYQDRLPMGQVAAFRMSVWGEHLCGKGGSLEPVFWQPASLNCVHRVNEIAEANWRRFIAPEVTNMVGHLMTYPISVDSQGQVTARLDTFVEGKEEATLPDFPTAPLFGANVNIPYSLTT